MTIIIIHSILWLTAVVSLLGAEKFDTHYEVDETHPYVKTNFSRQEMEISDLLHMFIALIKKADEVEGREFGLPEITTVPTDSKSASLEELFDRFETAARSFRTRFSKYLKTTEAPYSRAAPTISIVTKNVFEHVNNPKEGSIYNSEFETEDPVDPNVSYNESSTIPAFIPSNAEVYDSELETDLSTSTTVPGIDDADSLSEATTLAFILSNEESSDSEIEREYTASTVVPLASDSDSLIDETTLAFILSNEDKLIQKTESSPAADKDLTLTLIPITVENSESLSKKFMYKLKSDEFFNGATTLIFGTSENGESETEVETLFSTHNSADEVIATTFTTENDSSEEYTLLPLSSTDDGDFDEETTDIYATTDDDSDEETNEFHLNKDDSDDKTTESHPIAEDDSDEETTNIYSTTEEDSDEEIGEGQLAVEEDSDEETSNAHSTTEEEERSDEEETSTFMKKDELSTEKITQLLKILRKAAEKYKTEKSDTMSIGEELNGSESLMPDSESISDNIEEIPHVSELSMEYAKDPYLSANGKKVVEEDVSSKVSYLKLNSKDVDDSQISSEGAVVMQKRYVYSHLDVVGLPGEDYPNLTNIPATSFTCKGKKIPGLYADLETRCQVFHACWPRRKESYLCPVGTTFNQLILSCDSWFNSTCSLSPDYYVINLRLQDYPTQVDKGLYEYFDERDVYPYDFRSDHSHLIFNQMKFLPFLYKIINYSSEGRGIESGREIDYNETVEIEFDKNSTLSRLVDLQQETATDMVDPVKDRFREILRSFVESQLSKNLEPSDEDSSLAKMKLQERKNVYEKMLKSKRDRSGDLPIAIDKDSLNTESSQYSSETAEVMYKSTQSKNDKKQIASEIVFKALETAENIINKEIMPLTRDKLAASYIKLYKRKKL